MVPDGFLINAADAIGPDMACVAMTDFDAGDPYSVILMWRGAGDPTWARVDVRRTIVAIATLTLPGQSQPSFAALSDEGDVYLLGEDEAPVEKVPGMGIYSDDASGRGAATAMQATDHGLLVLGQQGQVFLRTDSGAWRSLSETPPDLDFPGDILNPAAALWETPTRLLVGGFVYPAQADNSRAMEALRAGDFALYAQLKITSAREQYGDLSILEDGRWRRLDLPGNATLHALHPDPERSRVLVAGDAGSLFAYHSEVEIEPVAFPDTPDTLRSIVHHDGRLVIAAESMPFAETPDGAFAAIETSGVEMAGLFRLVSAGQTLWAFGAEGIYRMRAGAWSEIEIPPGIVEIENR